MEKNEDKGEGGPPPFFPPCDYPLYWSDRISEEGHLSDRCSNGFEVKMT